MKIKKVLWFASRGITKEEAAKLADILKEPIVITEYINNIPSAYVIKNTIREHDIVCISKDEVFMKDTLKIAAGKVVIRPFSEKLSENKPPYRRFIGYKKINNIEIKIDEEDFL